MTANPGREESQIRELLDALARAVRAKDVDTLMTHYAPNNVTYDIPPPLQVVGVDAYRKNFEGWFESVRGPIDYDIRDLHVAVSDNLALCHYLGHVQSTRTTGEKAEYWVRVTSAFQKTNGRWLIFHEHVSMPIEMETMQAAAGLQP